MGSSLESAIRIFDLTKSFDDLVAVDDMNSRVERWGFFEESCQRVEDDREMKAKLPERWDVSTEQIKVLGEDQFE